MNIVNETEYKNKIYKFITSEFLIGENECEVNNVTINRALEGINMKPSSLYNVLIKYKDEIKESIPKYEYHIYTIVSYISSFIQNTIGQTTCIGCYSITNKTTKEVYIGESIDLFNRFSTHISDLYENKHHCKKLQRAFNETGSLDNFEIKPLKSYYALCCDKQKLKAQTLYMEAAYYLLYKSKGISLYNTINPYEYLKNNECAKNSNIQSKYILRLLYEDKYRILNQELHNYLEIDLNDILNLNDKSDDKITEEEIQYQKIIDNHKREIYELKKNGEKLYTHTQIIKMMKEEQIIPKTMESKEIYNILSQHDILEESPIKGCSIHAKDYALDNKLLFIVGKHRTKNGIALRYLVSEKGKDTIFNIFKSRKS